MAADEKSTGEANAENSDWALVKDDIFKRLIATEDLVRAVLSGRRRNFQPPADRIDVRPVLIKGVVRLKLDFTTDETVITKNYLPGEFEGLTLLDSGFSNFLIETRDERLEIRIGKKGKIFRKVSRTNLVPTYEHDRAKKRILPENDPYLIAVGISDVAGRVKPSMRDKYLQVEEFLKIIETSVAALETTSDPIRVIDLGCGHAYLTFAALRFIQLNGHAARFVGVDVKEKTRSRNEEIAKELGIEDEVTFVDSPIADYPVERVDIVIALHACDTATDDALAWAVASKAQVILAAPCCHHDLHKQITTKPQPLVQVFEHGILTVRQLDILTDALRAAILEIVGFHAEVFEFVSGEHTARNLMIRAIKRRGGANAHSRANEKLREYRHTCTVWGIKPALEERLKLGGIPLND